MKYIKGALIRGRDAVLARWVGMGALVASSLLVLVFAPVAPAQAPGQARPRPLTKAEQAKVEAALDRGVEYLKSTQLRTGTWDPGTKDSPGHDHLIGYAVLPGLTLLECGVSPTDPSIQAVARIVRIRAAVVDPKAGPPIKQTYELALAILFLDRLGNPEDEKVIQQLAVRLIAGQSQTGGWGYNCPVLSPYTHHSMMVALNKSEPASAVPLLLGLKPDATGPVVVGQDPLNPNGGVAQVPNGGGRDPLNPNGGVGAHAGVGVQDPANPNGSAHSSETNPGTLDGILSLLPSHGSTKPGSGAMPGRDEANAGKWRTDPGFGPSRRDWCIKMQEEEMRPERSDSQETKPTVAYVPPANFRHLTVFTDLKRLQAVDPPGRNSELFLQTTDNSNTHFAILALWAAQRHHVPLKRTLAAVVRRFYLSQAADGSWTYPYVLGGGPPTNSAMNGVGLVGLAVGLGLTDAKVGEKALIPDARIVKGFQAFSQMVGTPTGRMDNLPQPNLYALWAIERVGVLYNISTIGGKDWYRWGAEALVANQTPSGAWTRGGYPGASPTIDTCFAMLFLKRANLVSDLSEKLVDTGDRLKTDIAKVPPRVVPAEAVVNKASTHNVVPTSDIVVVPEAPAKSPGQADDLTAEKIGSGTGASPPPRPTDKDGEASHEEKTGTPWWAIVLLVVCVLLLGGGILFFVVYMRGNNEEELAPKRGRRMAAKSRKSRRHRDEEDEDDED